MSEFNPRRLKVRLWGQTYTFVGKASLANMKTTAKLLKQQLVQIKKLSPTIDKSNAAILLAFNALSNQLKLQDRLDRFRKG